MNDHNVTGWERALSLAVGIAGVGNGFKRGGITGLLEVAVSLMAVKRGLTGHCEMKTAMARQAELNQPLKRTAVRRYEAELGLPGGSFNVRPSDVVPGSDNRLGNDPQQPAAARDTLSR